MASSSSPVNDPPSSTLSALSPKIRAILPEETVSIRHSVLWPNHPVEHVVLPEDQNGMHFGAFVRLSDQPHQQTAETGRITSLEGDAGALPNTALVEEPENQTLALVAVISFFLEPLTAFPVDSILSWPSVPVSDAPHDAHTSSTSKLQHAHDPSLNALRFRKFACLPEYRGKGIGSRLFREGTSLAIQAVHQNQSSPPHSPSRDVDIASEQTGQFVSFLWCDARLATKEWYERRGMRELITRQARVSGGETGESTSERFFKGDIPYLKMVMDL